MAILILLCLHSSSSSSFLLHAKVRVDWTSYIYLTPLERLHKAVAVCALRRAPMTEAETKKHPSQFCFVFFFVFFLWPPARLTEGRNNRRSERQVMETEQASLEISSSQTFKGLLKRAEEEKTNVCSGQYVHK